MVQLQVVALVVGMAPVRPVLAVGIEVVDIVAEGTEGIVVGGIVAEDIVVEGIVAVVGTAAAVGQQKLPRTHQAPRALAARNTSYPYLNQFLKLLKKNKLNTLICKTINLILYAYFFFTSSKEMSKQYFYCKRNKLVMNGYVLWVWSEVEYVKWKCS